MAIARQIGTRVSEGFSETEIARELGTSSSSVSQLLTPYVAPAL
jgi:predicted transcriptional regulator